VTQMETITVTDGEGPSLAVSVAGPRDGSLLLLHAGSPGSRVLYRPQVEAAAASGFRIVSYDRPGYGHSPPQPGRRVADAARDALAITEALGAERFTIWGVSGGGPCALACAALLPDRVVAACVFASLGPFDVPDLDFTSGRSDEFRQEVELFFDDPGAARQKYREDAARQLPEMSDPSSWMARWGDRAGTDAAHSQTLAEHLAALVGEAARQGDEGWWEDWVSYLSPWGFDLNEIRCPVQLWHGEQDVAVPVAHGRWISDQLPNVESHFLTMEDHSTIEIDHYAEAIDWLREQNAAIGRH
jgi:pimeloyl-ACP methyl ester carboxylesterase